uniref:Peptidase S1 domain-containing protein n=1 Tax=Xenopus tropicalis TaxID=8364 RepID=A0A1B8XXQ0_XENTR|eukprot:XP_002941066.2 PREDICTED: trypsin-like [Xenopus tropicalis]
MYLLLVLPLLLLLRGSEAQTHRIIGGEECVPHSQPWQVALYYFSDFICGGALINQWWVLTAAHCIQSNLQVLLGAHNRTSPTGDEQYTYAAKICPHQDFEPVTYDNDIMLLKLASEADINTWVAPIPLASYLVDDNSECLASGWGSTTSPEETYPGELQCVNITTVSNSDCQDYYPRDTITDNMLCAGDVAGGKDTCGGDSGGPLVCNEELHGITSWGDLVCGSPDKPGVFAKVSNYIDWISDVMENEAPCYVVG